MNDQEQKDLERFNEQVKVQMTRLLEEFIRLSKENEELKSCIDGLKLNIHGNNSN